MLPWPLTSSCPECGASHGEPHWPACGRWRMARERAAAAPPGVARTAALMECRRRGWAVIDVPGEGLRPCAPAEPGAAVDLDRAAYLLVYGEDALYGADGPRGLA